MKTSTTKITNFLLVFLCFCFFSCTEDSLENDVLKQARSILNDNPENALTLLHSIDNPEGLEKDEYMQYILTLVQAKYKAKQNISSDTLIYEAKKYFNTQPDLRQKAEANLYAGLVYHPNQKYDKALSAFMQAEHYSTEIGDPVLAGRSLNNIGYIYYQQDIMDSAVVYYERALDCFDKQSGTELQKLEVLKNLGNSYALMNQPDKDEFYTQKGLAISKEINNRNYETTFMLNLGITYRDMGKYTESAEYLRGALTKSTTPRDSIKIYLNLSKLYNLTNQTDKANNYITQIKSRTSEIKDNYILKSIYGSLSDYYKQTGDYKQALHYSDLEKAAGKRILKENEAAKLYEANKKYFLDKKQKELDTIDRHNYWILGITVSIMLIVFVLVIRMVIVMRRAYRQQMADIEQLKTEYIQKTRNLSLLQNTYFSIIHGLITVEKEIRQIESEGNFDEQNQLKAKQLVTNIKQTANNELTNWAKDCIGNQAHGEKLLSELDDKKILLLALYAYEYTNDEIIIILELVADQLYQLNTELKLELGSAGLSDPEIEKMIHNRWL